MQLCAQMRKSNITGGNLEALKEKKASLLKELLIIVEELKGFEEEGLQIKVPWFWRTGRGWLTS